MGCMAVLTQSRGVAIAGFASVVVVLAIVPGDRLRRVYGLLLCTAAVLAATPVLLDLLPGTIALGRPQEYGPRAVLITLLVSIGAGLAWAAANTALERVREQRPSLAAELPRVGAIALACGAFAVVPAGAAAGGPVAEPPSH